MGRQRDRRWGDPMAVAGEKPMAVDRRAPSSLAGLRLRIRGHPEAHPLNILAPADHAPSAPRVPDPGRRHHGEQSPACQTRLAMVDRIRRLRLVSSTRQQCVSVQARHAVGLSGGSGYGAERCAVDRVTERRHHDRRRGERKQHPRLAKAVCGLTSFRSALVARALDAEAGLVATIRLTDDKGRPLRAAIPKSHVAWEAGP